MIPVIFALLLGVLCHVSLTRSSFTFPQFNCVTSKNEVIVYWHLSSTMTFNSKQSPLSSFLSFLWPTFLLQARWSCNSVLLITSSPFRAYRLPYIITQILLSSTHLNFPKTLVVPRNSIKHHYSSYFSPSNRYAFHGGKRSDGARLHRRSNSGTLMGRANDGHQSQRRFHREPRILS